jgi:hypothetical protein
VSVITSQAGSFAQIPARKLLLGGAAVNHRLVSAFALALLFFCASPAFALKRLATFAWAPASGAVAGYAVYATTAGSVDELVASVAGPSAVVEVESSDFITISVAAYDSAGRLGPRSDASTPLRLCPGDFDGDEVVGAEDWVDAQSCFGMASAGFCAGADLNLDGLVSASDIQSLQVGSDACAGGSCAGDFDGDGVIGMNDVYRVRQCFGQAAQGACAAGDMDGNGVVSSYDVNYLASAWGQQACSL